jgi:phosphatidylserine/phosphatidylglycerophosphate/cardiolipin synthase-like enzyme
MWGGTYEGHEVGGHHQKSLVVGIDDQIIAYCGGVDFAYARWARPSHRLNEPDAPMDVGTVEDPVKIEPQMGLIDPGAILGEWNDSDQEYRKKGSPLFWHDVHVKVAGPAAADLADNFIDRYNHADSPFNVGKADVNEEPDFTWVRNNYHRLASSDGTKALLKAEEPYASGRIFAQTLRSYYTLDDYGIWDAYRHLLSRANYSVYIENQYAFEDVQCMTMFREIIMAKRDLKVIIVAPFMPDSYESNIRENLTSLIQAGMDGTGDPSKARVVVYSLLTSIQRDNTRKNVPIYVHAKLAVVDDEWAIVGSANLDRMGMGGKGGGWGSRGSSELALLVHGKDQALALRNRLVSEHLGSKAPQDPDDFDAVFKAFIGTAEVNGKPRDNKPLTGQVCFHKLYNGM